jgi:hypothetical protein
MTNRPAPYTYLTSAISLAVVCWPVALGFALAWMGR